MDDTDTREEVKKKNPDYSVCATSSSAHSGAINKHWGNENVPFLY